MKGLLEEQARGVQHLLDTTLDVMLEDRGWVDHCNQAAVRFAVVCGKGVQNGIYMLYIIYIYQKNIINMALWRLSAPEQPFGECYIKPKLRAGVMQPPP